MPPSSCSLGCRRGTPARPTDHLPTHPDHLMQESQNLVTDDLVDDQIGHMVDDALDQPFHVLRLGTHPFNLPEELATAEFPVAIRQSLAIMVQAPEVNGEEIAFCEPVDCRRGAEKL